MQIYKKDSNAPFLKWAGGKRWLVNNHADLLNVQHKRFIEPFLGSGAVFFKLAPIKALLSDKNEELIETYSTVKEEWWLVAKLLRVHHKNHCKKYYYKLRAQKPRTRGSRAARFIYLNRTCWNGLYRVNGNGDFNVPIGGKTNVTLETDDFEKVSQLLSGVTLIHGDFEVTMGKAKKGDFIFVDPPYTVKHNSNAFIKYNENLFSWDDQVRLRDSVVNATRAGAKVVVTNANHKSIRQLYFGIGEHTKLSRSSVIAGDPSARGDYEELLIRCI